LHYAVRAKKFKNIEVILNALEVSKGLAKIKEALNVKDVHRKTPINYAKMNKSEKAMKIVQLLKKYSA
jgi:ankyrin repeat protein